ncbi:MAG: hypothetical protein AUG13_02095 [Chloroflexi bacterium 13_1_20CM_2_59_7]|nr:MAG: hypothetical protein AUG13_02095 [Chloroflexi bacterium 13_1_20CM_2_59_7]
MSAFIIPGKREAGFPLRISMLLKTCSAGRFSFPVGIWDLLAAGLSPVLLRALGQSNSQQCASDQ